MVAHMPPSLNYTSVKKEQGDTMAMQFVYLFLIVYSYREVKNFSAETRRRFFEPSPSWKPSFSWAKYNIRLLLSGHERIKA